MGKRVAETERKYEAAEQTGEPDLQGLPGVAALRVLEPAELDAVYVDTSDLRLATHRITLRRRTGGDDAGWHLKLPSSQADTRTEVHAPLGKQGRKGGPRVPKPLLAEVAAIVRDRDLVPVVRLRNTRKRVHLVDDTGAPLVEIAHDHVRATVLDHGDGAESAWNEVETELLDGDTALLDALEKRLRTAGLRRSKSPSKLARALGDRLTAAPRPPGLPSTTGTAGDIALAYVHEQVAAIIAWDPAVRRDEPDSVHQMRVSTRRLRSAFKSFRRELDRAVTDPIGDELKWLAAVLGLERDREVLAERLRDRLAELPEELVTEALTARIAGDAPVHEGARKELLRELGGGRYFRLLDTLESLLTDPPLLDGASAPAARAVAKAVARDHKRLRRRVEPALAMEPGHERDIVLHDARKAAKRARYSGEAAQAVPALRKPAKKHTKRMKAVQQLLGEHQDSVICRDAVLRFASDAREAGEDTFAYGALYQLERDRAAAAERQLPKAWPKADRGRLAG
ncbi:CYTH and CHAD domain-containing protein [Actinacidiphila glaucinigra]|uniref:CYTH and CHAD domain-containing protein n=1 Tax=Actinacidiphila glaucinigra TaxID=235986 RepID=UPI002E35DAE0|nr:CYTH and CHAD domain-containing protein [Actinacidiphila glaucinigra]